MARPTNRTPAIDAWIAVNPLRVWRTVDRGLTIAEAAQLLGVTTTALGHWETGARLPSAATYQRLQDTLPADLWQSLPIEALHTWHVTRPEET